MIDDEKLIAAAKRLRTEDAPTEFSQQDKSASADAIENFLDTYELIEIDDLKVVPADKNTSERMTISGVSVSIRPDAYLEDPITGDIKGAVKLHFPKTTPLNEISAEYVATAMKVYIEQEKKSAVVDYKKCYVIDVSTKQVTHAPKAYKRKMNDITAACEEIEARWKRGGG